MYFVLHMSAEKWFSFLVSVYVAVCCAAHHSACDAMTARNKNAGITSPHSLDQKGKFKEKRELKNKSQIDIDKTEGFECLGHSNCII